MSLGTLGILAAGSIAGVAVYNVASNSSPGVRPAAEGAPSSAMPAFESIAPFELPSVPEVPAPAPPEATSPITGEPASPTTEAFVSRGTASAIVLAEAPGVALKVTSGTREGYRAWAVQVQRPDGSVVTGYVDRASGVIFAWTMDREAPVIAAADEYEQDDDEQDDDYEQDDEDEQDDDGGEHGEHEDGEDDD